MWVNGRCRSLLHRCFLAGGRTVAVPDQNDSSAPNAKARALLDVPATTGWGWIGRGARREWREGKEKGGRERDRYREDMKKTRGSNGVERPQDAGTPGEHTAHGYTTTRTCAVPSGPLHDSRRVDAVVGRRRWLGQDSGVPIGEADAELGTVHASSLWEKIGARATRERE